MTGLSHKSARLIENHLNRCIIGNELGVRCVACAVSAHISRIIYNQQHPAAKISKDLLMVCGNSGCGKTQSIKLALESLNMPIPYAIIASNTLSCAGYKGRSVDTVLQALLTSAQDIINRNVFNYINSIDYGDEQKRKVILDNAKVRLAEQGILVFDEFDKLTATGEHAEWNGAILNQLLRMVEGGSGYGEDELSQRINTEQILFIFSGAFGNILNPQPTKTIGYGATTQRPPPIDIPSNEQLISMFGRELVGRITQYTRYYDLSEDDLYRILKQSQISCVLDYERLIETTNNTLIVTDDALRLVAKKAKENGTGARGLRTILGKAIYDAYYRVDGVFKNCNVIINADVIEGTAEPQIEQTNHRKGVLHAQTIS